MDPVWLFDLFLYLRTCLCGLKHLPIIWPLYYVLPLNYSVHSVNKIPRYYILLCGFQINVMK